MTPPLSVLNVMSPLRSMWTGRTGGKPPELTGEGSADDEGIGVVGKGGKKWM